MAHNFKDLTEGGVYTIRRYISKAGHDSNDGLTPDTATKTIPATNPRDPLEYTQLGAGVYDISGGSKENTYLYADGKTVIKGGRLYYRANVRGNLEFIGTHIDGDGVSFSQTYMGVVFRNCSIYFTGINIQYSKIIDTDGVLTCGYSGSTWEHNIVVNTIIRYAVRMAEAYTNNFPKINSNYFNRDVEIINLNWTSNSFGAPTTFLYNNCRNIFRYESAMFSDGIERKYALQDELIGTPQDNGYDVGVEWISEAKMIEDGYLGWTEKMQIAIDTCMNKPPLFNNQEFGDFTLQAGSPHIGAAQNNIENIGGTPLAVSVINTDSSNTNIEITTSPEIDTTNPNSFTLKTGFNEGFIDYIQKISSSPITLGVISPISTLNFDSDFGGGSLQNNNVPDSEPSTSEYPRTLTTTSNAVDAQTLVIDGHNISIGEYVRVNGEDREIISTTINTVRVNYVFRSIINAGVEIQISTKINLGSLNPNRLTYQLRTSKKDSKPVLLSDWENDADPLYNVAGKFLIQEWETKPGYVIDFNTNTLYGNGDSSAPRGLALNEISCKWVHLRVFLRNNYNS